MKRILFVDDEPNVLDGFRRMLAPMQNEWEMAFLGDGASALQEMRQRHFDVIVTDLRMPGMDGIELLAEVVKISPDTVRMVLSGHCEQGLSLQTVLTAHQYLTKPCDLDTITSIIDRALMLRDLLSNQGLKELVSRMNSLPSLPSLYLQLVEALRSEEADARDVGEIIGKDLAMTAKVLQLVNSACFGLSRDITSVDEAVVFLGVDTIRSLTLSISVFSAFQGAGFRHFSVDDLTRHSNHVASFARALASKAGLAPYLVEEAFLAGLLHDIGRLILASNFRREYDDVVAQARVEKMTLGHAEIGAFGATHAQVGAYLLWLWGLPDGVTEAAAYHHSPAASGVATLSTMAVVHTANELLGEDAGLGLDTDYLSRIGVAHRIPEWKQMAAGWIAPEIPSMSNAN